MNGAQSGLAGGQRKRRGLPQGHIVVVGRPPQRVRPGRRLLLAQSGGVEMGSGKMKFSPASARAAQLWEFLSQSEKASFLASS